MRKRKHYTSEERDRMLAQFLATPKGSRNQVAAALGVNPSTMYTWAQRVESLPQVRRTPRVVKRVRTPRNMRDVQEQSPSREELEFQNLVFREALRLAERQGFIALRRLTTD